MNDKNNSNPFEENEEYLFQIFHPAISDTSQPLDVFSSKTTYSKAIKACIAMVKEFDLSWAVIMHEGWFRTIFPDALWLTDSGILISEQNSTFKDDKDEQVLLKEEPLLERTSYGWGILNSDTAMDGMLHKHIAWHLKPILSKCFKQYEAFEYHLFSSVPEIPEWLIGEKFSVDKAVVIYGSKNEKQFDENISIEISIAMPIQSVFGSGLTNEWLKSYREFY